MNDSPRDLARIEYRRIDSLGSSRSNFNSNRGNAPLSSIHFASGVWKPTEFSERCNADPLAVFSGRLGFPQITSALKSVVSVHDESSMIR